VDAVAVIARTGFFVLCSVFKERGVEKTHRPELDALMLASRHQAPVPASDAGATPQGHDSL